MEFEEIVEVHDRGKSVDVHTTGSFDQLMISSKTLERLTAHGFKNPSPVQEKAIPIGLMGRDMLVQAKSGTGKTLVFSVLAVENVDPKRRHVQKLIVAPTREIATQIRETVKKLASPLTKIAVFIGGYSLRDDILNLKNNTPHIVIGTTGRICQLINKKELNISQVDFFALDEADKLMDECFQKEIHFIISCLPPMRQVAVFSATYPKSLDKLLSSFLRDCALVRFSSEDVQLVGIKQYVITNCYPIFESLSKLMRTVQFSQALVFCDTVEKCEPICNYLVEQGFQATFVSSAMSQKERQSAIDQLRTYCVKILVSSDLTSRGIDADRVNLVVNIDTAINPETYFHRIGRAARFGGQGAAVTLLENVQSEKCFTAMASKRKVRAKRVKSIEHLPIDLPVNSTFWETCSFFVNPNNSKSPKSNEYLDAVPEREEAVNRLEKERIERGESDKHYKYSREDMIKLREISENKEMEDFRKKEIENEEKENSKKDPPKSFTTQLDELKNALSDKKEEKQEEQPKKKFKFVPIRQKAKQKFYMRGELMSIRDSANEEEWKCYAKSKWNLTEEPFMIESSEQIEKEMKVKTIKAIPNKKKKDIEKAKITKPKENDGIIRYNRKEMIGIQLKTPKHAWLEYVKSKWNTKEEPFELDQHMRCPFEERLRRIRAREKAERKKVIEDRKKERESREGLISSGRTSHFTKIPENNYNDYASRLNREFETFTKQLENGENSKNNVGPVIPLRDPPMVWKYRVHIYKQRLEQLDAEWNYDLAKSMRKLNEVECGTDVTEKAEVDVQTESVHFSEIEISQLDSQVTEIAQDFSEMEVNSEGSEGSDEQSEDSTEQSEDEGESLSSSEASDEDINYEELAESYRQNVEFSVVFDSYIKMMTRK